VHLPIVIAVACHGFRCFGSVLLYFAVFRQTHYPGAYAYKLPVFSAGLQHWKDREKEGGQKTGGKGKGWKVSVFLFVTAPLWVSNVRCDRASHASKSDD